MRLRKLLLLLLAIIAMLFFRSGTSGNQDSYCPYEGYEPVGTMHSAVINPDATRNFQEHGKELSYIELTTGDAFVIEGTLMEGKYYTVYRDDMGTPDMTDDKIIAAERLL